MRKILQIMHKLDHGLNTIEINPDLFLRTPRQYIFYPHSNEDYEHLSVKSPYSISHINLAAPTLYERRITLKHLTLPKLPFGPGAGHLQLSTPFM